MRIKALFRSSQVRRTTALAQSGTSPTNDATTAPQTASPAAGSQPVPSPSPAPAAIGLYRNGSYNGDSVDAYFGNVQVEAIVSGGKLADVKILTYPNDRSTSLHINNSALPKLVQEAIASQSAQVDIVSGATQTSQGFQASLASALAKAKKLTRHPMLQETRILMGMPVTVAIAEARRRVKTTLKRYLIIFVPWMIGSVHSRKIAKPAP